MTSQKKKETINTITVLMQILAVALLVWLAYTMRIILIDLILAVTIASAISPAARWGQERKIPRPVTVLVTYLIIAVFYGFMGYLLYTPVREQALLLKENFPGYLDSLNTLYQNLLLQFGERANLFTIHAEELRTIGMRAASSTLSLTTGVFGFILNGIFILFLASYFVVDAESIWNSLLRAVPPAHRDRARALIGPVGSRMGGYVRGQLLVSTAVAAIFAIGLSLIGVRYGIVLGLLAGLMNLVPFVGSFITFGLALIVAFNQSMTLAAFTVGLFVIEQAIESNFIVPQLLGKQVDLHPLIVLFAILVGATLGGGMGAVAAVPLTSAALYLLQEFYIKPINNETAETA
jgi:predicted PurR-regulated permease PerM